MSGKKENIWNVPNILTLIRLALIPVYWYLILTDHYYWALGVFAEGRAMDQHDFETAKTYIAALLDALGTHGLYKNLLTLDLPPEKRMKVMNSSGVKALICTADGDTAQIAEAAAKLSVEDAAIRSQH